MIKKLLPYAKEYKWYTILAPLFIVCEVILEVSIPRIMANIVDIGIPNKNLNYITNMGILMIIMAVMSLFSVQWQHDYHPLPQQALLKRLEKVYSIRYRIFPLKIWINSVLLPCYKTDNR